METQRQTLTGLRGGDSDVSEDGRRGTEREKRTDKYIRKLWLDG